ncbi:hypothetical protein NQ176_g5519 [Zarea fungicola]|uniref:Uncharacterized protein n=1 Tax=Zarea fungicola TaxID=93591 RepID=A0ACC1NAG6_9HYPO|nr:hypothetical protein NQ176_g5519 [Lecanicillium fungicola]
MSQHTALDGLFARTDQGDSREKRPSVEGLIRRNRDISHSFKPMLTLKEMGELPLEKRIPMPKIFLVACDDPRIKPHEFLGLQQWGVEEVVVALGVAGRIKHQFENMVFLDHFLQFEDIMIIHHTDCSAGIFPGEDIQAGLRSRVSDYDEKKIELPTYTDLNQSVRDDLAFVKSSPLVRPELANRTRGFVFDIKTGKLREVLA